MKQLKPWEEAPDEAYWMRLLGTSQSDVHTVSPVEEGWALAQASYAHQQPIEVRVVGYNRGGVLVAVGNVRGFVPASQLVSLPRQLTDPARAQALANYVGTTLRAQIIELDRARNRLILSERLAHPSPADTEQLLNTFTPGQIRQGIVRNVTDFGAFVDLGGVEGLVHVSELSWHYVPHPRQALQPGQTVDVYILQVNHEQKRIACSIKRLTPNPWLSLGDQLKPGDWTEGVVTSIVPFGVFVRVAAGVEGLVHISEWTRGNHVAARDNLQVGQTVRVRVLELDIMQQRMKLGLPRVPTRRDGANATVPPPPEFDPEYWDFLARLG